MPRCIPPFRIIDSHRSAHIDHSPISFIGTHAGASGSPDAQMHLHWELHIDGHYLGIGLSDADTRAVYTALFVDADGTQK